MTGFRSIVAPVAALLAAGLVGGLASIAVWEQVRPEPAPATAAAPAETTPAVGEPAATADQPASISGVVKQALPSVVEVRIEGRPRSEDSPFPFPLPGDEGPRVTGLGSGWVLDEEGHVVTNQHVVSRAETLRVTFEDGTEVSARVVGTDPSTDVAVLKLDEVPENVRPLPLGSTSALELGDALIAIGSPLGLQGTVTAGIVSSLGRDIRAPNGFTIEGAVQTDAALNHGNSGGPLLDLNGRVVGMNAQIATDSGANSGIGYAIPVETVRRIADALIADGKIEYAYLGVAVEDVDEGARITEVRGEPARDAGLQVGDVVTRAGDAAIGSGSDLRRAVESRSPGDELELTVRRDGETRTFTVTLGTRPASTA